MARAVRRPRAVAIRKTRLVTRLSRRGGQRHLVGLLLNLLLCLAWISLGDILSMSTQPTISSYFSQSTALTTPSGETGGRSKRGGTPIDLTFDSDGEGMSPPRKRQRTTSSFFGSKHAAASSPKPATQAASSAGHAQQWRFDPASPTKSSRFADGEQQRSAHERAKKILLGGDNIFNRRKYSDDAPLPSEGGDDPVGDGDPQSEEENKAEKKFGELLEMFSSAGTKKKGKSTAKKAKPPAAGPSRSRGQKVEEVGPSGQTYTPFELQVCPAVEYIRPSSDCLRRYEN